MLEILKNYLRNEEYYIILYSNYVFIYNYEEILCFNSDFISIKIKHILLNIKGDNLLITKLQSKELLIKGNINILEKKYE